MISNKPRRLYLKRIHGAPPPPPFPPLPGSLSASAMGFIRHVDHSQMKVKPPRTTKHGGRRQNRNPPLFVFLLFPSFSFRRHFVTGTRGAGTGVGLEQEAVRRATVSNRSFFPLFLLSLFFPLVAEELTFGARSLRWPKRRG